MEAIVVKLSGDITPSNHKAANGNVLDRQGLALSQAWFLLQQAIGLEWVR